MDAAARAEALGWVVEYLPAQRAVPRHIVGAALAAAAERGGALGAGWDARFREEFGEPGRAALQGAAARGGVRYASGRAAPGTGDHFEAHRTGATALADQGGLIGSMDLAAAFGTHLAVQLAPRVDEDAARLDRFELVAASRVAAVSLGRQYVAYGEGFGGTVMLSGRAPLPRVEVQTPGAARLPGVFRVFGPVGFHTFLGRIEEARHERRPYIWGARGVMRPHPRVTLGIQRVSLFGGEGVGNGLTLGRIGAMLLGVVNVGDRNEFNFANQQVSVELKLRLPTDRVVPLTAYLEWGTEDAAGAWQDVPGRVVGLFAPRLPGLPGVSLGVERASFAGQCCGNPAWYRHKGFQGGWAARDAPMGHPLGGHGTETLVHGGLDLLESRLRAEVRAFERDRGADNLFVPGREGRSLGLSAEAELRLHPRAELSVSAGREAGDGWTERSAVVTTSIFF